MTQLTNIVTVSTFVDLGAGPMRVQCLSSYGAVCVVADTAPAADAPGHVLVGLSSEMDFATSSHVWARAYVSPDSFVAVTKGLSSGTLIGENHIGEVGGNVAKFQTQFGPASSTTYTAGQVLLATTEITNAGRVAGGTGLMLSATLELAAANSAAVDAIIFASEPAGAYTAGSTFALNSSDRAKVSKVIKLTDWTALGVADSLGEPTPAPKFYKCDDATKTQSLWVALVARGSITLTSTTSGTFAIRMARN